MMKKHFCTLRGLTALLLAAALMLSCAACSGASPAAPAALPADSDVPASVSAPEPAPIPEPEPEPEPDPEPQLSDDWQDLQLMLNDELLTIPFSAERLGGQGYRFGFEDYGEALLLLPGNTWDHIGTTLVYRDGQGGLASVVDRYDKYKELYVGYIYLLNPNGEDTSRKKCFVGRIRIDAQKDAGGQLNEGAQYAVFPGGITIESTREEVVAAYGEPDETTNVMHTFLGEEYTVPYEILRYRVNVEKDNVKDIFMEFHFDEAGILLSMEIGFEPVDETNLTMPASGPSDGENDDGSDIPDGMTQEEWELYLALVAANNRRPKSTGNGSSGSTRQPIDVTGKNEAPADAVERVEEFLAKYPTGTTWDDNTVYKNFVACAAYAFQAQHLAFGEDADYVYSKDPADIRQYSIVRISTTSSASHWVFVLSVNEDGTMTTAEGNVNGKVMIGATRTIDANRIYEIWNPA